MNERQLTLPKRNVTPKSRTTESVRVVLKQSMEIPYKFLIELVEPPSMAFPAMEPRRVLVPIMLPIAI